MNKWNGDKKEASELAKQDKYDESIQFMKVLNNYKDENKNLLVVKSRFSCDLSVFDDDMLIHLLTFELNK